jgi:hypothetical protein
MNDYNVGQRVTVDKKHAGTVIGGTMCMRYPTHPLIPYLLVELSEGYYDPKHAWVSIIVAHPDNVEPV